MTDVSHIPGVPVCYSRGLWNRLSPYPVTGPPAVWADIDTAVIHYTADDVVPDGTDPGRVAKYLANIQTAYAKPTTQGGRGYSIGYMWAVDQTGAAWQLRGWEYKSAANAGHNGHTLPILMLVDGAAPATPAAVRTTQAIIADGQARAGRPFAVTGHGQLSGASTTCPGVGLRAQVTAGAFTPAPTPEPEDDPDMEQYLIRDSNLGGIFSPITDGPVSRERRDFLVGKGVPIIDENHPQSTEARLYKMGPDARALYGRT